VNELQLKLKKKNFIISQFLNDNRKRCQISDIWRFSTQQWQYKICLDYIERVK